MLVGTEACRVQRRNSAHMQSASLTSTFVFYEGTTLFKIDNLLFLCEYLPVSAVQSLTSFVEVSM